MCLVSVSTGGWVMLPGSCCSHYAHSCTLYITCPYFDSASWLLWLAFLASLG